jgi:hypothetical protein
LQLLDLGDDCEVLGRAADFDGREGRQGHFTLHLDAQFTQRLDIDDH